LTVLGNGGTVTNGGNTMKILTATILGLALCVTVQAKDKKVTASADCTKTVAFSAAYPNGTVSPYMAGWVENWIRKNAKKHPSVCFSQTPLPGHDNYVVVFSESRSAFNGLEAVTTTSTTPVSGSGSIADNRGQTWTYTYNGTVTTTQVQDLPYTVNNRYDYAVAYNSTGTVVASGFHLYSSRSGGAPGASAGYNIVFALSAINARGRLLSKVISEATR
jgi:hypothetical protein